MYDGKWFCFDEFCAFRNKEEIPIDMGKRTEYHKEQRRKQRYGVTVRKMLEENALCHLCGELAETLHHKNERHSDNRKTNLLPICRKCHLEITHNCDKPFYYQSKASDSLKKAVTTPLSVKDWLQTVTTSRISNKTIYNPTTYVKIRINECNVRCLRLLLSWGFTELK